MRYEKKTYSNIILNHKSKSEPPDPDFFLNGSTVKPGNKENFNFQFD